MQTAWKLNDFGSDLTMARPEFVGGVESLPQPNRHLSEQELAELCEIDYEIGDDYDKRALYSASHTIRITDEGVMQILDAGAPFDLEFEPLNEPAKWLHHHRGGRGIIHIIPNSHAVGRSRTGRVIFLAEIDLEQLETAMQNSIDKGDDFDEFLAGWGLS